MKSRNSVCRNRHTGFTLIELVMVLVILTALAALVVPIIDTIRRQSDKSTASFAMKQLAENIGLFRIQTGRFPARFDSLMQVDSGTSVGLTAAAAPATARLTTTDNLGDKGEVVTLTAGERNRMDDMFQTVMLHDTGNAYRNFQGNSGVLPIDVGPDAGEQDQFLVVSDDDSSGQEIINAFYPGCFAQDGSIANPSGVFPNVVDVPATGVGFVALGAGPDGDPTETADNPTARLLILGVGPSNEAVGRTMQSAPAYAQENGLVEYNRFLAIFSVFDNFSVSRRPQLRGVMDSTGDFLDQEIIEVAENTVDGI